MRRTLTLFPLTAADEREEKQMEKKRIGFIGLGTMGFPICYGLYQKGYSIILPAYRRERDEGRHYIPLAPDRETKAALYEEMLSGGCVGAKSQKELIRQSEVLILSVPTFRQVEALVEGKEGILENAIPGTIIIDLTSSDAAVTRRLSTLCEEKNIEFLDCPVSGGYQGATNQTLSVMVGGKQGAFEMVRPILETIGEREKVVYLGGSGAGNVMKCANNFLSSACLMATTEALCVLEKAGIDPKTAAGVIAASGGSSSAVTFKYPEILFKGKPMGMSVDMILKDVALFNAAAKEMGVPIYYGGMTYQILGMPSFEGKGDADWSECVRQYKNWCRVNLGI